MKHSSLLFSSLVWLAMLGLSSHAVDNGLPQPADRTHTLLAAADGKKKGKDAKKAAVPVKITLSDDDVKWLKDNYGTIISRAKEIKAKKEEVAQEAKSISSRSSSRSQNQARSNMRREVGYMKEDLKKDIEKWHKSYDGYLAEKKTALEKAEQSLGETKTKVEKAKAENNVRDAEFAGQMIPSCETAVKKAQKEYDTLQGLPSVIVEMP